jgi:hypothetical protein
MVKLGIISDTHITNNYNPEDLKILIDQLKGIFREVDQIIHAGDICTESFLEELKKIARVICVKGDLDTIVNLEEFIKLTAGKYNIGVIHKPPEDIENFFKKNNLQILIHGHTHQPIMKGTTYNTLILNPGSPTKPKAPPQKKGFLKPVARRTVITLEIDEKDFLKTFIVSLKF